MSGPKRDKRTRVPKSDARKKRNATLKKSRARKVLPISEASTMSIQWKAVQPEEQEVFLRITRVLEKNNMLGELDQWLISEAATLWVQLKHAREEWVAAGNTTVNDKGNAATSPELEAYRACHRMFLDVAAQLGLSPRSRKILLSSFEKQEEKKPPMALYKTM